MFLQIDDNVQLHYESSGEAHQPTLLLWHGARCTLRQWDHVVSELTNRFHIVRFDIRGAGQSAAGADGDYTFATYAADACKLLDDLNVSQCHVWSMAWGSRAAFAFCAAAPERIISAALFDLSISKPDVAAQRIGTQLARAKQRSAGYVAPPLPDGWNQHLDEQALAKSLAASGKIDLASIAHKLTMPVLIATGDHDPNLASSRDALNLLSNAQLVELENVGHGSVLMQPRLCTDVLLQFIGHSTAAQ
jgi:pimeloyl-ACP methyl ester carboxylesterase